MLPYKASICVTAATLCLHPGQEQHLKRSLSFFATKSSTLPSCVLHLANIPTWCWARSQKFWGALHNAASGVVIAGGRSSSTSSSDGTLCCPAWQASSRPRNWRSWRRRARMQRWAGAPSRGCMWRGFQSGPTQSSPFCSREWSSRLTWQGSMASSTMAPCLGWWSTLTTQTWMLD